ncbi:HAD-IIIC family phosphatase [Microbispora bryophytorum]|uniref:HAD-IIIC family phosphatase n=2 Tax=Microbispora bryophytorum TaxID=1460882 RepID=UPI0033F2AC12
MPEPEGMIMDALLDALREAALTGRAPDPATRRALLELDDAATARQAGRRLARTPAESLRDLRALRVAIVATCTVGSFEPLLWTGLVGAGFRPVIDKSDYGAFDMTLAGATFADRGDPDIVVSLLDASYFLPREWSPVAFEEFETAVRARLSELTGLVTACAERTPATLILHTVPLPAEVRDAFLGLADRARMSALWHRLNAELLDLGAAHPQVVTVDLAGALADLPAAARDARLHRYGDLPYTDEALHHLAGLVRRVAQAKQGLSRKVLAIDLDNTLWGGVLGEVDAHGVQLGGLYPGNAYKELQRTARRLRDQGVILVLASKNDPEPVEKALSDHPEMLLRNEAFSVRAVNWSPKAGNLRKAAASLGLSVESFVFMDDSDFERGHVAAELPEVAVVSAAGDPAYMVDSLLRHGWFDVMSLTDTDRRRPELYRTRAMRSDFSEGFGSSQEFLEALRLTVEVAPVTEFTVARVAQLAARTNQFNLTGVRFDEATTARMRDSPDHLVASVAVSDRFGDEGVVGALWVERAAGNWRVLNMVLSCRVLGRGVELATAAWLVERARRAGAELIESRYVPSQKNGVAADFWSRAGFTGDGTVFTVNPGSAADVMPGWITFHERSAI